MSPEASVNRRVGKIMLVGSDPKQILEKRFRAAGCQVVKAPDDGAAIDHARRESLDATVLISKGSLIDIAETFFNLRDLNRSMEIIVLVNRRGRHPSRFLRQLLEHPIEGTRIFTRRQLQKRLQAYLQQSPPGTSLLAGW
jgi:DNA-binding response OmpR family regulator